MNFLDAVNLLKSRVNWKGFFVFRQAMKTELNNPTQRFIKSEALERGLCRLSNNLLVYRDLPGRDCQFVSNPDVYLECKGNQSDWHLGKYGKFRLVNGNSKKKKYDCIPKDYAQFVMFHNLKSAFLIESVELNKYLVNDDNGNIEVIVPIFKLEPLFIMSNLLPSINVSPLSDFIIQSLENYYDQFANL